MGFVVLSQLVNVVTFSELLRPLDSTQQPETLSCQFLNVYILGPAKLASGCERMG